MEEKKMEIKGYVREKDISGIIIENKVNRIHKIKWLASTIGLTFFPTIALVVMCFLQGTSFELVDLIKNGEIVLSSLLVVTSTLFDCYNDGNKKRCSKAEGIYYSLIWCSLLELVAYTTIRTNPNNSTSKVYIVSVLSAIVSIAVSWGWNQLEEMI